MSSSAPRIVTKKAGTLRDSLARSQSRKSAPDKPGSCQSMTKRSKLSRRARFIVWGASRNQWTSCPSSFSQRRKSAPWSGSSSMIAMRTAPPAPLGVRHHSGRGGAVRADLSEDLPELDKIAAMKNTLKPGLEFSKQLLVDESRCIGFMGKENAVYATPRMVSDVEYTCRDFL